MLQFCNPDKSLDCQNFRGQQNTYIILLNEQNQPNNQEQQSNQTAKKPKNKQRNQPNKITNNHEPTKITNQKPPPSLVQHLNWLALAIS